MRDEVKRNPRRIAVLVVLLAAAAAAVSPALPASAAGAAGGSVDGRSWSAAAVPTTAPTSGGDRAVELGVVVGPAPTRSPTATPTTTPRPPAPGGGPLPRTGVALVAILLTGAVLVAVGAGLRVIAWRRGDTSTD